MTLRSTIDDRRTTEVRTLYIHIPFCRSKCPYCHFYSIGNRKQETGIQGTYFRALERELLSYAGKTGPFETIYFGGGTPTLVSSDSLIGFLGLIRKQPYFAPIGATKGRQATSNEQPYFAMSEPKSPSTHSVRSGPFASHCFASRMATKGRQATIHPPSPKDFGVAGDQRVEISIEANPEGLTEEYLTKLSAAGFNRISIGCQSFDDAELESLGRRHNSAEAIKAIESARMAGFENINIDLMGGIPGTKVIDLEKNIDKAMEIGPEHLSVYLLEGEEDAGYLDGKGWSEDDEAVAMTMTHDRLVAAGYNHYETSNYARPGRECRHNLAYWRGKDYLGLGPSACSTISGRRIRNPAKLTAYIDGTATPEEEIIDRETRKRERVMLGLRLNEGISLKELSALSGDGWRDFRGRIELLEAEGFMSMDAKQVKLTDKGRPLADRLAVELF